MTRTQLEANVEERFGMNLHQFLTVKWQKDALFDYEIAYILNVSPAYVRDLRRRLGIKGGRRFLGRFERTYGKGAVDIFSEMIQNPDNSLSDTARVFGFSREYARQVYQKIYGRPYTAAYGEKIRKRKDRKTFNFSERQGGYAHEH